MATYALLRDSDSYELILAYRKRDITALLAAGFVARCPELAYGRIDVPYSIVKYAPTLGDACSGCLGFDEDVAVSEHECSVCGLPFSGF